MPTYGFENLSVGDTCIFPTRGLSYSPICWESIN